MEHACCHRRPALPKLNTRIFTKFRNFRMRFHCLFCRIWLFGIDVDSFNLSDWFSRIDPFHYPQRIEYYTQQRIVCNIQLVSQHITRSNIPRKFQLQYTAVLNEIQTENVPMHRMKLAPVGPRPHNNIITGNSRPISLSWKESIGPLLFSLLFIHAEQQQQRQFEFIIYMPEHIPPQALDDVSSDPTDIIALLRPGEYNKETG